MMATDHAPFPSDETLAAYIDGRLDEETRNRVTEHMASCAECFDVLLLSNELNASKVVRGVNWTRNIVLPLAAAAAVAAVLLVTPVRDRIWPRDDLHDLAEVAPPQRLSDGRVAGFPFRERAKTYRGGNERDATSDQENWKFFRVAAQVHQRATEHRNAETLHADGVAALVLGKHSDAVTNLESAVREETQPDARLLSDLAAAYIAAGRFSDAATTAERAWQLSQTPEIAWNRAVAAEHVEPPAAAIAKWNKYLELEPKSPWLAEAQKHVKELQEPR